MGWEALLPLQEHRTFHLWVCIGEGTQVNHPFKLKGGDGTREGSPDPSSQGNQAEGAPGGDAQSIGCWMQTSFLNPSPFLHWYGVENVAKVRINRESCMALLDNGAQINIITPHFIEECSLDVGPRTDLVGGWVACLGLGNALTQPLGYIIIQVQVDGVQGYDEDQIPLVILDMSNFVVEVPVILGTPTICGIINVIKEKEIDALMMPLVNAQVAYLLAVWQATATTEDGEPGESDPNDYDEIVTTKEAKTIDAFSSWFIQVKMKIAHRGEGINVMTQALHAEDGSLPQGLTVQNIYTRLHIGSKDVAVVVSNSMAYSQTLRKKLQWQGQVRLLGYQNSLCRSVWWRHQKRTIRHPSLLWSNARRSCLRN